MKTRIAVLLIVLGMVCLIVPAQGRAESFGSDAIRKKTSTVLPQANGNGKLKAVSAATDTDKTGEKTDSEPIETIEATDQDGNKVTVKVSDVAGLTGDWLKAAGYDPDKHTVKVEKDADGKVKLLTVSDKDGNTLFKYDSGSRLMEHYHTSGDLKGKVDYVTSESTRKSTWRDATAKDPGMGKDGHVVVQKFKYDDKGEISSVEYYTWTAGNRKKAEDQRKYSRYMYRQDTYKDGELEKTAYYDDPRPTFWEPTITGTISKDNQGRYFLTTEDGKSYMLTARKDGFDADGDGKVGADEMSAVDWESYVGKELTVRGHQFADENESDIYVNGKKAEVFGVVDVVQTDKGEKLAEGWETVGAKVTEVMDKFFILLGEEKDTGKIYDKIYAALAKDLKEAGISDADIEKFADAAMKEKWQKTGDDDDKDIDFTKYTDSQALLKEAWKYYDKKDYANAIAFSEETITRYKEKALEQQKSLKGYAASGKEGDYWALNDVATAYFIIGESHKNKKEYEKARERYNYIIDNLGYAQCYDTKGWWWKVKEAAEKSLKEIKDK